MDEGSLEQLKPVLLLRQLHGVTWAMATWSGPFLGDSPCCWADLDDASSPKQYFSKARPALGGPPSFADVEALILGYHSYASWSTGFALMDAFSSRG